LTHPLSPSREGAVLRDAFGGKEIIFIQVDLYSWLQVKKIENGKP